MHAKTVERLAVAGSPSWASEELSTEWLWEAGVMAGEQLPNVFQLDCLAKLHYGRNCVLVQAHHTEGTLTVKVWLYCPLPCQLLDVNGRVAYICRSWEAEG